MNRPAKPLLRGEYIFAPQKFRTRILGRTSDCAARPASDALLTLLPLPQARSHGVRAARAGPDLPRRSRRGTALHPGRENHRDTQKVGATKGPRPSPPIRPGTDRPNRSRQVARHDKRTAWSRDGAQCAFVAPDGRRCSERAFLEFHHVRPYALGGPGTADNISLRCRRHNQFEAEVVFGPRDALRERVGSLDDRG
jgi:hypothetical protein